MLSRCKEIHLSKSKECAFLTKITDAIQHFCAQLGIKEDEIENQRVIIKELIEVNSDITLLVFCPPAEQICIMNDCETADEVTRTPNGERKASATPTMSSACTPFTSYIYLQVQVFEALNMSVYESEFIKVYSSTSVKLEIEHLASIQYSREAFSNEEILNSKRIANLVSKYQKSLEELWKDSRWLIEAINNARDKPNQLSNINLLTLSDLKKVCKNRINPNNENQTINVNDKRNIYNQLTKLPEARVTNFNHIDSVLIDDEDLLNLNDSVEDLRLESKHLNNTKNNNFSKVKCVNIPSTKNIDGQQIDVETKRTNLNKLVSKVYISTTTTPILPTSLIVGSCYFEVDKLNQNLELSSSSYSTTSESPMSDQSSNSLNSNSLEPSHSRNVIVHLDIPTDLKIDMNFECIINNKTDCRDLISHIIKKANNLIHAYFTNANSYFDETPTTSSSEYCYKTNKELTKRSIELLDENFDLYYLIVILNENQEKILMNSFLVSSLREPWSKGKIHLRKY